MNTPSDTSAQPLDQHIKTASPEHMLLPDAADLPRPFAGKMASRNFESAMREVTRTMPAPQRLFSRLFHLRAVASLSDMIGSTIARPNALLFGAIFSFAVTAVVYVLAKNLGYRLSGFESIGAFIMGWLIGLTYDFLKLMITGKR